MSWDKPPVSACCFYVPPPRCTHEADFSLVHCLRCAVKVEETLWPQRKGAQESLRLRTRIPSNPSQTDVLGSNRRPSHSHKRPSLSQNLLSPSLGILGMSSVKVLRSRRNSGVPYVPCHTPHFTALNKKLSSVLQRREGISLGLKLGEAVDDDLEVELMDHRDDPVSQIQPQT